jgi:hypothetical protein
MALSSKIGCARVGDRSRYCTNDKPLLKGTVGNFPFHPIGLHFLLHLSGRGVVQRPLCARAWLWIFHAPDGRNTRHFIRIACLKSSSISGT